MTDIGMKRKTVSKVKVRAGLDIGSFAIKVLEASDTDGSFALTGFGIKRIVNPSKEALAGSIKSLVEASKVTAKEFAVSVSGPAVLVRFILMPRMKEEELRGAVKFEAEKFIPFNIEDCVIDFHILQKNERENKLDIILVVAKKAYVEERIKSVEDAGFSVSVVDADPFALANAFLKSLTSADNEKTFALLNVGAANTNLSIMKGGIVRFVRDVSMGGNDFTAAISKGMAIDLESAEALKIAPKEKSPEVINCTKGVFNNLLDELRLSFGYYENQYGRAIDVIYISGGSAGLAGMDEAFQDALGSKPILWDPLKFIDTAKADRPELDNVRKYFGVAAGLVLR